MMASRVSWSLLLRLSLRSLFAHRIKGLIVGSLLAFGTFLLVFGTTLLANVERAMEASVTGSLTGHIQLLSEDAKDALAFTGPDAASEQDLGVLHSFADIKEAALSLPNVKAVVPMGRHVAGPMLGNEIDRTLDELRLALGSSDETLQRRLVSKLRRALGLLIEENERLLGLLSDVEEIEEGLADLRTASAEEFWEGFEEDPQQALDFLDTRIAKLGETASTHFIPFIGTDLDLFTESFESFTLVDGEMVPKGRRGFLFNKTFYEENFKNRVARGLDRIEDARTLDGRRIDQDPSLQQEVKQLSRFIGFITRQLVPEDAAALEEALSRLLPTAEGELDEKLAVLLELDDGNFEERRAFFYEEIAPKIRLYDVYVGETFTLRSSTRAGYPKAINLKIYGTFQFKGLERSAVASAYSLMDLMSFRDLFGLMTVEKREELDSIRSEVGISELSRDDAEDALFGWDEEEEVDLIEEVELGVGGIDIAARLEALASAEEAAQEPADWDRFDPGQIDDGAVIHAAVVLEDPSRIGATLTSLQALSDERGLGFKALPWSAVTGIIGQLIVVVGAVLYITIAIIFLVALVIINNSMVMATMDRVSEIGTMRAIGAGRRFVLALFLFETLLLGALASGLGAGAATGLTLFLGQVGIPASSSDFLIFLFGGPALHPTIGATQIALGLAAIFVVSLVSTLYPARIAARIAPVVAMQAKE